MSPRPDIPVIHEFWNNYLNISCNEKLHEGTQIFAHIVFHYYTSK